MSTTIETSLDIDLSLLVGAMEDMACEHSRHDTMSRFHDKGPATHYIKTFHEDCGYDSFYAACTRWAQYIGSGRYSIHCAQCKNDLPHGNIKVVGPVPK